MNGDLSILRLIVQASPVVQLVIAMLLAASLMSWAIIFSKRMMVRRARSDADPVTLAKNRFGKLLEVLPEDKMHELHRAFGDVIGPHPISEATRLAIYRYAIFLLESPSATPPSEPPF